jgi:hypothetical protein
MGDTDRHLVRASGMRKSRRLIITSRCPNRGYASWLALALWCVFYLASLFVLFPATDGP